MKIIKEGSPIRYNEIKAGDVFLFDDDIYIKTVSGIPNCNAVSLSTGEPLLFLGDNYSLVYAKPNAVLVIT